MICVPNTVLRRAAHLSFLSLGLLLVTQMGMVHAACAGTANDSIVIAGAKDLDSESMSKSRGGTVTIATVTANQTMESTSTGNSMTVFGNLANGSITVGDTFGGSGIGSYVMNTGNNSVINSGVSLSVLMLEATP